MKPSQRIFEFMLNSSFRGIQTSRWGSVREGLFVKINCEVEAYSWEGLFEDGSLIEDLWQKGKVKLSCDPKKNENT